jgi:hypothetical protein
MHTENAECSEDDDMVAMERQLATRAARTSKSSVPPPSMRRQSSPVYERRESPDNSRLPLPDQSPTPESPVHAPPSKNNRPVLPASPSETAADMVHSRKRKRQAAASSEYSPTPGSPVQSHNRKDVIQPLENIFNDDSPLTDEEEVTQPAKRTRKGGRAQPQRAARKPRK